MRRSSFSAAMSTRLIDAPPELTTKARPDAPAGFAPSISSGETAGKTGRGSHRMGTAPVGVRVPTPPRPASGKHVRGRSTRGLEHAHARRGEHRGGEGEQHAGGGGDQHVVGLGMAANATNANRMMTLSVRRKSWCDARPTARTATPVNPGRAGRLPPGRAGIRCAPPRSGGSRARSLSGGMMALPAPTPQPNQGDLRPPARMAATAGRGR